MIIFLPGVWTYKAGRFFCYARIMRKNGKRSPFCVMSRRKAYRPSGTYECFHCGEQSVIWSGDADYEDYGLEGTGIIHECRCSNCGAEITYRVPLDPIDEIEGGY